MARPIPDMVGNQIDNEAAPGAAVDSGRATYVDGGTIRHRAADKKKDKFFVSDKQREAMGVLPHETLHWARDPKFELYKKAGDDRVDEIQSEYDEARLVAPERGGVRCGVDLVLMAIPTVLKEANQRATDEKAARIQAGLSLNALGEWEAEEEFSVDGALHEEDILHNSAKFMRERKKRQLAANRASSMIGGNSATAGMSLAEAERRFGDKFIKEEEAAYRGAGRHEPMSTQQFQSYITGNATPRGGAIRRPTRPEPNKKTFSGDPVAARQYLQNKQRGA